MTLSSTNLLQDRSKSKPLLTMFQGFLKPRVRLPSTSHTIESKKPKNKIQEYNNDKENYKTHNISNSHNLSKTSLKKIPQEYRSNYSSNSKSSSEKKRLMLKHRRFERRPHFPTDRSDSSSLQLSSLPYAMSENNLHEVEAHGGGTIQPSKLKLQNELKLHFHNRHMSNPAHYQSCDAAKPTVVLKAKAASRLMFNRQESLSRVS